MECQYGPRRKGNASKRYHDGSQPNQYRQTCPARSVPCVLHSPSLSQHPSMSHSIISGKLFKLTVTATSLLPGELLQLRIYIHAATSVQTFFFLSVCFCVRVVIFTYASAICCTAISISSLSDHRLFFVRLVLSFETPLSVPCQPSVRLIKPLSTLHQPFVRPLSIPCQPSFRFVRLVNPLSIFVRLVNPLSAIS